MVLLYCYIFPIATKVLLYFIIVSLLYFIWGNTIHRAIGVTTGGKGSGSKFLNIIDGGGGLMTNNWLPDS